MNHEHGGMHEGQSGMQKQPYVRLLIMLVLSFISMYILMYAMVNSPGNIFNNLNEFYMAGLMAAPMVMIELLLMGSMYTNKRWNAMILLASAAAMVLFFVLVRQQGAVGDRQFLRSMIPHHASAILMCEKASIRDPEIKDLCQTIISGQQSEIDQMKAKLEELSK